MNKKTIINMINEGVKNIMVDYKELLDKVVNVQYNLKLENIFYYNMRNDEEELFNIFCNEEYEIFHNFMENNFTELQYIGRTSTFYITDYRRQLDKDDYYYLNIEGDKRKALYLIYLALVYEYNLNIFDLFIFDNESNVIDIDNIEMLNFLICTNKDYLRQENFKELVYNFIDSELMDCLKVANYIIEFKENQIEIWNNFKA